MHCNATAHMYVFSAQRNDLVLAFSANATAHVVYRLKCTTE
jgi:hypothetical protein